MNPCLFTRKDKKIVVFIVIYVDDNLIVGHEAAVDKVIKELKENGLMLKVEEIMHDYVERCANR